MIGIGNNSNTNTTKTSDDDRVAYIIAVSIYMVFTIWLFVSFVLHMVTKKMWKKTKNISLLIILATVGPLLSFFILSLEVLLVEPFGLALEDDFYFYVCKAVIILQMVETFRCHLFLWLRQNFLYESSVFSSYNSTKVKVISLMSLTTIALMFVTTGVLTFVERNCCTKATTCEVDDLVLSRRILVDLWNVIAHVSLFLLFYLPTSQKHTSTKSRVEEGGKEEAVKRDVRQRWSRLIRWCFCRALICITSALVVFGMNFYRAADMLKYIVVYSGYLLVNEWSTVLAYDDCLLLVFRPFTMLADCFKKFC